LGRYSGAVGWFLSKINFDGVGADFGSGRSGSLWSRNDNSRFVTHCVELQSKMMQSTAEM